MTIGNDSAMMSQWATSEIFFLHDKNFDMSLRMLGE